MPTNKKPLGIAQINSEAKMLSSKKRTSRSKASRLGTNSIDASATNENVSNNARTNDAPHLLIDTTAQKTRVSVKTRTRSISPHARSILHRTFSRSRSRSRSRSHSRMGHDEDDSESVASSTSSSSSTSSRSARSGKQMLVAVTSCRSDAYYSQKAPGAISMLPRKAPSALKTFHELAVGMKDAYEAVGATPIKMDENSDEWARLPLTEQEGRKTMWDFLGNVNFLLALVDEVATDSATRGALKDDAAFKSLRDVIKRCNKVLERMLVRRENKFTLFYRLVQAHDAKDVEKMQVWNGRVEKAVAALSLEAQNRDAANMTDSESDAMSDAGSISSAASGSSGRSGLFRRGRGSSIGRRTRSRRATPTPKLRNRFRRDGNNDTNSSADDGFAADTPGNVAKLQKAASGDERSGSMPMPKQFHQRNGNKVQAKVNVAPMAAKDELVDMIRDLRTEKKRNEPSSGGQPEDLKPNWMRKADVPGAVPKLPIEYIHRHRLMKQVVNSLINRPGAVNRENSQDKNVTHVITSITSRHADKAGNGKTTLAAAAIQSVEVRERFGDGIAWIQLGRAPLSDKDIRRLYEELYDQLFMRDFDLKNDSSDKAAQDGDGDGNGNGNAIIANALLKSRKKFQGTDLEGMKEDLGRMLHKRNVLICLDDVWRIEDARRFIFEKYDDAPVHDPRANVAETCPYRILVTTRTPGLMGDENANEVFVRILSEQEAVKLLLSSAGRRLYGGKNTPVFNEARVIVKGCGNSPLALRLAGGMLRTSNRNWTLSSRTWLTLVDQCKASLEEASRIRSFVNSVGRVVDLSFVTVDDLCLRASLRRCFVTFAMVFHDNDLLLTGRGIPRGVVRKLFINVISGIEFESNTDVVSPDAIIDMLEHMNLLQRAGHDAHISSYGSSTVNGLGGAAQKVKIVASGSLDENDDDQPDVDEKEVVFCHKLSYLMHESIKHIAADMAARTSSAFAPKADNFTSFRNELDAELEREEKMQSSNWLSSAAKYLFSPQSTEKDQSSDMQFHELMTHALMSKVDVDAGEPCFFDGDNVEKYLVGYLPTHLIRAQMYTKASELLLDRQFIRRRVEALGCMEATQHHMTDLVELRKEHHRYAPKPDVVDINAEEGTKSEGSSDAASANRDTIDPGKIVREGSRRIADAVCSRESRSSQHAISVDLAICMATIGEGLLKARQTKESIVRLEEAVHLFRDLLGSYHVEVAKSLFALAKAYVKTGDEVVALSKLSEASGIYESCNATLRYDAISNAQLMATLLVNSGDWESASSKYDEVIALKSSLYGEASVPVAKSMNDYAIVLAKHSRMSEALRQYEAARAVFQVLSPQRKGESLDSIGIFAFDITLIDLNIASIKSKLANYKGALESYERGVEGLRLHIQKEQTGPEPVDVTRQAAQRRHLVSAIGRIGSLRMKLKDNEGALKAYLMLLDEVDKSSPLPSQMEKAKAHVKCATIYRQLGSSENNSRAVSHLQEALSMYSKLHGTDHKDTKAIASSLKQWQKVDKA